MKAFGGVQVKQVTNFTASYMKNDRCYRNMWRQRLKHL